jgi:hypothetical protein
LIFAIFSANSTLSLAIIAPARRCKPLTLSLGISKVQLEGASMVVF